MTQPTVDPLNCHRFILADIMPPNRQELVVRRIIVCTVQRDAPGFCYAAPCGASRSSNRFSVAASPHSQSMRQSDQKPARSTACSFLLKEMPEFVQFHHNHALARIRLRARRVRCRRIQFRIDGVETPSCLAIAFIDRVYNSTAVSFFHSGSPRGGLKLVCRRQSLHFHFAGAALRVGTP
jgi:hypothetical protein